MDSDDSDATSQPDQYARDNGLSLDSQVDPFSFIFHINDSVPQLTPDAGPTGLTSDVSLPHLHLPAPDLRDQPGIAKECSNQVARSLRFESIDLPSNFGMPLAQYEAHKRLLDLKLELPALSSDPDYDYCEWTKDVGEQRQPVLHPKMFPLERLDIANDEGLEFAPSILRFRQKLDRIMIREKLDVPQEAIHHLACALQDDWSDNERSKPLNDAVLHRPFVRDMIVTPPLSPCTEHEEHFIPKVDVCEVPFASDPSSMLSDDLKAAESVMMLEEFTKDVSPIFNVDTPVLSPLLDLTAFGGTQPRITSFKMESPVPPNTSPLRSPNGNRVDIRALLKSMDPDHILSHSESSVMKALEPGSTSDLFDPSLETVMKECAVAVWQHVEQEQISAADAAARVKVPNVNFEIPEPEWQGLAMDSRVHLIWLYESYGVTIPLCSRDPRLDCRLRWIPFLEKFNLHELTGEVFDCGISSAQLLNSPDVDEVPTTENYIWKRPGLAILRESESESEDGEVEPSLPNLKPNLASLAKKRRFENGLTEMEMGLPPTSNQFTDPVVPFQHIKSLRPAPVESFANNNRILPSTESDLTVSVLLANYIDIRSTKRHKQDKSIFFMPPFEAQTELGLAPSSKPPQSEDDHSVFSMAPISLGREGSIPNPCPGMTIPSKPTKLIKGLTLSRKLFSMIEKIYPAANIIERDFGRWDRAARSVSAPSKPYILPPLTAEADIIISPATGIIVTTLLKVIQKPVSAQAMQSSIRERIMYVALRYEKLVVLVSEGNTGDETVRKLTPSETAVYSEFIAFIAGLDSHIEVFYVGGGEVTLAKWLLSSVIQHVPEATGIQEYLVQDETVWEVFLRQMGFNAYAAQAILIRLKARHDGSGQRNRKVEYGLSAFMTMPDTERMQKFRDLMGGETMLKRVNQILRTQW